MTTDELKERIEGLEVALLEQLGRVASMTEQLEREHFTALQIEGRIIEATSLMKLGAFDEIDEEKD